MTRTTHASPPATARPATTGAPAPAAPATPMTHREVLEALSGLLLALFVAMLSSTIVTNALPTIVTELHGNESGYSWVVVATLLTTTASTPVWGKLADLFSKKLLVQMGLTVFAAGSVLAGLAPNMGFLIGARAVQGIGVGGLTALVQVVIASIVPPRERGRYSGYIGATFALATVSGPLVGGLIVDTPGLGWRWCFFVGIPVALLAFGVLQKTLHVKTIRRADVSVDYVGAALIAGGVSTLLVWVSLAGTNFAWLSSTTYLLVGAGLLLLAAAVAVELRVREPIIPMRLFRDRTTSLAVFASIMVGVAMFGGTVFLSQYFQVAHGMTPTQAGLMSIAMVGGLVVSSMSTGRIITRRGRWKRFLVGGMMLVVVGLALLTTINADTSLVVVGSYMAVLGVGLGGTLQNLVLAVQNNTAQSDMGAASSLVAFFRTLGGSIGVSALGAALGTKVSQETAAGLARAGVKAPGVGGSSSVPNLSALPPVVRSVVMHAFGDGTGHIFLLATPFAVLALVAVLFIHEVPLRTTIERADELPA
ncbi:MAG: hypothetical protein QOC59_1939, partial [Microbacteriaceae bacterium]|nr:hypothetical protein [Microbacteriaceae bacterium]